LPLLVPSWLLFVFIQAGGLHGLANSFMFRIDGLSLLDQRDDVSVVMSGGEAAECRIGTPSS